MMCETEKHLSELHAILSLFIMRLCICPYIPGERRPHPLSHASFLFCIQMGRLCQSASPLCVVCTVQRAGMGRIRIGKVAKGEGEGRRGVAAKYLHSAHCGLCSQFGTLDASSMQQELFPSGLASCGCLATLAFGKMPFLPV